MKNNELTLTVLAALTMAAAAPLSASAASNTLFNDVPQDHWAYPAIEQLAKDGILTGYDDGSFRGDALMTRYDMAQIIANARTHMAKATPADQELITKLSDEFRDDLDDLGVRVTRLEKKQENVRLTGSFAQKYEKAAHDGYNEDAEHGGTNHRTRWQKELKLNIDADVPKTPITFHATLNSQLTSYEASGWGSEEETNDDWNGGHERRSIMRPETYYVGGPLDRTGLEARYGAFYEGSQNEFVNHAVLRGASLSHQDKRNWFSVFTGRLDVKDEDTSEELSSGTTTKTFGKDDADFDNVIEEGWTNQDGTGDYYKLMHVKSSSIPQVSSTISPTTDFIRHGTTSSASGSASGNAAYQTVKITYPNNGNWSADWNTEKSVEGTTMSITGQSLSKTTTRRRTLYGATFGHRFSDHLDATIGYYNYTSAAYDADALRIYALTVNQRLGRKMNLYGAYAHGNQDGYDQAWTAELQYNGGEHMSSDPNHAFGYYIGYRYLAPDALVKTVYEDGAQIGQRGWEGGLLYNFTHNFQGIVKYFYGSSITNPGADRSKVFSSLTYNF